MPKPRTVVLQKDREIKLLLPSGLIVRIVPKDDDDNAFQLEIAEGAFIDVGDDDGVEGFRNSVHVRFHL